MKEEKGCPSGDTGTLGTSGSRALRAHYNSLYPNQKNEPKCFIYYQYNGKLPKLTFRSPKVRLTNRTKKK